MRIFNDELKSFNEMLLDMMKLTTDMDSKFSLLRLLLTNDVEKEFVEDVARQIKKTDMVTFTRLAEQMLSRGGILFRLSQMKIKEYEHFIIEVQKFEKNKIKGEM